MPETRTVKGFAEVGLPLAEGDFECSSLQPLRYASVYKYSLLGTNHMISRWHCYDRFGYCAEKHALCAYFLIIPENVGKIKKILSEK